MPLYALCIYTKKHFGIQSKVYLLVFPIVIEKIPAQKMT